MHLKKVNTTKGLEELGIKGDNIKMKRIKETGWGCRLNSSGSGEDPTAGSCENGNETSGSLNYANFLTSHTTINLQEELRTTELIRLARKTVMASEKQPGAQETVQLRSILNTVVKLWEFRPERE
jgi:hypothetical protein